MALGVTVTLGTTLPLGLNIGSSCVFEGVCEAVFEALAGAALGVSGCDGAGGELLLE